MKKKLKKYLPWGIRFFIFILFMVSAIAKVFPIWAFEKQFVDMGISSWCWAPYFARFMIAAEIALGIAIIQPHFIKRIVIPATILLLAVFCIHLTIEMFQHGAMTGNCGCFGQLIPMTPLEAFIKNIVIIGLLIYLYRNVSDREKGRNKPAYLIIICLASALCMFLAFPFCPCKASESVEQTASISDTLAQSAPASDSGAIEIPLAEKTGVIEKPSQPDRISISEKMTASGPPKVKSRFSDFTSFGNTKVNLDNGKYLLCFFAPGCDHCRDAARQIDQLSNSFEIPPVYVFFMNEEVDLIPGFFQEANCQYPYRIIEIPQFWDLLGMNADTPGVFLLWNGNIIKFYEGTGVNKFDSEDLRKAL